MDGHTYEEDAIRLWLASNSTSPMTGAPLRDTTLIPNHQLRSQIEQMKQAALTGRYEARPATAETGRGGRGLHSSVH